MRSWCVHLSLKRLDLVNILYQILNESKGDKTMIKYVACFKYFLNTVLLNNPETSTVTQSSKYINKYIHVHTLLYYVSATANYNA